MIRSQTRKPTPAEVLSLVGDDGRNYAAAKRRWGLPISTLKAYARKARGRQRQRPDADHIMATAQRLGSCYRAGKALGIAEGTVRSCFEKAGLDWPRLPGPERWRKANETKAAVRAAKSAPAAVRKPVQLSLFG
jgi:hypothetical protein